MEKLKNYEEIKLLLSIIFTYRNSNCNKKSPQKLALALILASPEVMSNEQKIDCLLTYTLCRKSMFMSRVEKRFYKETKTAANQVVFSLQMENSVESPLQFIKLLYCLAKLKPAKS